MSKTDEAVKGICHEMCSEREWKWRENNGLLHFFEINKHHSDKMRAHPEKVIKQFSRSAAGKSYTLPEDLRPSPVLLKTLDYLINEIVPNKERSFIFTYDFVNNRIQAIRQDITIQIIEDSNTVEIFEKCVRFYILASYLLCEEPLTVFDMHLNNQQLTICLEKLLILYEKFDSQDLCDFLAIYFSQKILNLELFHRSVPLFKNHLNEKHVKLSIETCIAYMEGNFIRFFKLVKSLPIVLSICFFHYFPSVRLNALTTMSVAYSSNSCKFPIETLSSWLCIEDKHVMSSICKFHNIKVDDNYICFKKSSFKTAELLGPKKEPIIDSKLKNISLSKFINGYT